MTMAMAVPHAAGCFDFSYIAPSPREAEARRCDCGIEHGIQPPPSG